MYPDARESFEDHSLFLKRKRYAPLFELKIDDYKGWARGLKRCGYATSPTYAKALIELIDRHGLEQYDTEGIAWLKRGEVPDRTGTAWAQDVDASGAEGDGKAPSGAGGTAVQLGQSRASGMTENDVSWVMVKANEPLESLAKQLGVAVWQLRKYNDLEGGRWPNHILGGAETLHPAQKAARRGPLAPSGLRRDPAVNQRYGSR